MSIPGLPGCDFGGRFGLPTQVAVGEAFTTTFDIVLDCPDGLRARSVVIVLGGFDADAVAPLRQSLADLVAGLADSGGSRVAIVSAGALAVPPRFADLATERPAVDAAIEGLTERPAPDANSWAEQVHAASEALQTLSPQQRPLLVIVDGLQPTGDATPAVQSLVAALSALPDVLGFTVIVDVSPNAWLRGVGEGRQAGQQPVTSVYVRPATVESLPSLFGSVIDAIGAPIDLWLINLSVPQALEVAHAHVTVGAEARTDSGFMLWSGHINSHRLVAKGVVVARFVAPGADYRFNGVIQSQRHRVAATIGRFTSPVICVHAVGDLAGCLATPTVPVRTAHALTTPTFTPAPISPPALTPGPRPSPSPTASPGTSGPGVPRSTRTPHWTPSPDSLRRRLFVPYANRGRDRSR